MRVTRRAYRKFVPVIAVMEREPDPSRSHGCPGRKAPQRSAVESKPMVAENDRAAFSPWRGRALG